MSVKSSIDNREPRKFTHLKNKAAKPTKAR